MIKEKIKKIITIIGPLLLGAITSIFMETKTFDNVTKPMFSPPKIVFPIVWSILYLLMGISLYLVLKKDNNKTTKRIFMIQLLCNLLWSFLFFNLRLYYFSVVWIFVILFFVTLMIVDFYNIKKVAGYLQLPYFIWLLIALYLNIGVAILN